MKTIAISIRKVLSLRLAQVLWIIVFLTPLVLGHPQWLVGTVVNAALFIGAAKLSRKNLAPLIIFPSIGAVGRGVLFGSLTPFLIYFMPFIWTGNAILVYTFSHLQKGKSSILQVAIAAAAKALLLFLIANIFFKFSLVPSAFLFAMGGMQFVTALSGGLIALTILKRNLKR